MDKDINKGVFDIANQSELKSEGETLQVTKKPAKKFSKKRNTKRKEKIIDSIISVATKMTKEDAILVLSSIANGTAKDFTGLPPSLETRIKAIDKLMPLLENEPSGQLNSITVNIVDSSNDNKIKEIEKKIINGNKDSKAL